MYHQVNFGITRKYVNLRVVSGTQHHLQPVLRLLQAIQLFCLKILQPKRLLHELILQQLFNNTSVLLARGQIQVQITLDGVIAMLYQ